MWTKVLSTEFALNSYNEPRKHPSITTQKTMEGTLGHRDKDTKEKQKTCTKQAVYLNAINWLLVQPSKSDVWWRRWFQIVNWTTVGGSQPTRFNTGWCMIPLDKWIHVTERFRTENWIVELLKKCWETPHFKHNSLIQPYTVTMITPLKTLGLVSLSTPSDCYETIGSGIISPY